MTTIPAEIDAMVELLVRNELIRVAPVVCKLCRPGEPCWWCRSFHAQPHRESQSVRLESGE
jgi:hypothetical protein